MLWHREVNKCLEVVHVTISSIGLMTESELVTTTVNWIVNNQKCIEDAVKVMCSSVNNSDDIEETVSVESCIHLRAHTSSDGNDEKCTLKLECCKPDSTGLSQLIVVSEAKKLEIYTDHGEYLQTVSTDFIDKIDEDFIVYKGVFNFEKPVSSCIVKFASLRKPHELWLYGARITLISVDKLPALGAVKPVFDMDKVLQRIQGSDHQLSGKAQNFAKFLAMCKKSEVETYPNYTDILGLCSSFLRPPLNPQMEQNERTSSDGAAKVKDVTSDFQSTHLLKKYLEHLSKGAPQSAHGLTSVGPMKISDDAGGSGEGPLANSLKDGANVPGMTFLEPIRRSILEDMDKLISRHVQEMEDKLWSKLNLKLSEMENKQEQRMKKLEDTLKMCLINKITTNS